MGPTPEGESLHRIGEEANVVRAGAVARVGESMELVDRPSSHRYPVTVDRLVERWSLRRDEFRRFASMVDGGRLCEEVLADLRTLDAAGDEAVMTLSQAALCSGYSREHLGRMVRRGKIPNAGRLHAPKIRLRDLPLKAGYLPQGGVEGHIRIASKRQIVRSIVDREGSSR